MGVAALDCGARHGGRTEAAWFASVGALMNRVAIILCAALAVACTANTSDTKPKAAAAAKAKPEKTKSAKEKKVDKIVAEVADGVDTIKPALLRPAKATSEAPASYKVNFDTTKGMFVVEVTRDWAPLGADRFYNLVGMGYYDDIAFFRAINGFMVQFGIHGEGKVNGVWKKAKIKDDPVTQSNTPGYITFATSGKDSRTVQVFLNLGNNKNLDNSGFAPFGKVIQGMDVVKKLYTGYGEGAPRGKGPSQGRLQGEGNAYLRKEFPELDYIKTATLAD